MTLIEAAKLALEHGEFPQGSGIIHELRQAIAKAEQQELSALAKELDGVIADVEEGDGFDDVCLDTVKYVRDQLAASPKREWQGLTDEEVRQMCGSVAGMREAVREAEAKLKEKNT